MKSMVVLLMTLGLLAAGNVFADDSVAERAGKGIKKGGKVVAKGVEKGGEATVKGLKKSGDWLGKKLQLGGEKLEKASK